MTNTNQISPLSQASPLPAALEALAQPTRYHVLRCLLAAGPRGIAAGQLARQLNIPHNTLSFHLSLLVKAGLARSEKIGRNMFYHADFAQFQSFIDNLNTLLPPENELSTWKMPQKTSF
jgi:DNA-binding transcriptional ArsR family regulator